MRAERMPDILGVAAKIYDGTVWTRSTWFGADGCLSNSDFPCADYRVLDSAVNCLGDPGAVPVPDAFAQHNAALWRKFEVSGLLESDEGLVSEAKSKTQGFENASLL